ncbi:hypothetical protein ASC94_23300 [Massilia sp. Root418]|uniref:hypothetical protein n=1 Tax=Massilia sp. Root418 TaxID=1736532 RepID=UPI0006F2FB3F|nr:hypothetical protein [Massilia sp. Root418]KQW88369.1 hypothetical protein ASC94_23300 [Massilia sp. Root418]
MKAFTLAHAGKGFLRGQWLLIASSAAPDVNRMAGPLATFDPATGAATVNVKALGGDSGSFSACKFHQGSPIVLAVI